MASNPNLYNPKKNKKKISSSQPLKLCKLAKISADDDDFEDPSPSLSVINSKSTFTQNAFKPSSSSNLFASKKLKIQPKIIINHRKENNLASLDPPRPLVFQEDNNISHEFELDLADGVGLDLIESTIDIEANSGIRTNEEKNEMGFEEERKEECGGNSYGEEFEGGTTQLDLLLKLCDAGEEVEGCEKISNCSDDLCFCEEVGFFGGEEVEEGLICCPLCGNDISELSDELRQVHTNQCLDKDWAANEVVPPHDAATYQCPGQVLDGSPQQSPRKVLDISPVLEWLRNLGLAKYEEVFVQEEIDWDTLKWLTEEDLCSIGVTALGPRKKIIHALNELKKDRSRTEETHPDVIKVAADEENKLNTNKLITDYFPGFVAERKRDYITSKRQKDTLKRHSNSSSKSQQKKNHIKDVKHKTVPIWCCIPGTPFCVDAFKYLKRDCSHWFLTHFHMDHYQGLTRSFCHGKIYCSSITAKLVNMKLGISWDKLQALPLNQKINIAGIDVTCYDANHCPGAIIILFEPPNGKAVLHTGDFRFSDEMSKISPLQTCLIHTLILDTTYCDPQYDFPKQEDVIQFVIEAIQAEAFNPSTLFLIGSYTIGKERLFLEVARVLRKKVYVSAAKLRLLQCLDFPNEDAQWFTLNEHESHIHVVPMWTLASFKRLKYIANQYAGRFNLIVAFSPTGWTFSKGKKKSPGRRWQQGTIIRYEVPYSEHCSFSELREFVKFISPANIIPSVNNHGPESTSTMVSHLLA
ncbi:hypothetical protein ACH5RR_039440 [Cinchona calisaya]|uniref:SAM domain-containing protein n=1 Tax=Cinchona calisaya TaxID=153742 RepID=A0ABD2Y1N5_9GENT